MIIKAWLWFVTPASMPLGVYLLPSGSINEAPVMTTILDVLEPNSLGHKLGVDTKDLAEALFPSSELK